MDLQSEVRELKRKVDGNGQKGLERRVNEMEVRQEHLDESIRDIHANTKVLIEFMTQEQTRDEMKNQSYNKNRDQKTDTKWLIGLTLVTFTSLVTTVLSLIL